MHDLKLPHGFSASQICQLPFSFNGVLSKWSICALNSAGSKSGKMGFDGKYMMYRNKESDELCILPNLLSGVNLVLCIGTLSA